MAEETKSAWKRYGILAFCGVLILAAVFGAYRLGRSAGPGGDIGEDQAKSTALNHAGISEDNLSSYEIARDNEAGVPVYEIEFAADGCAYDYVVNAATGSIVKFDRDTDGAAPAGADPSTGAAAPADNGQIGEERAWEAAFDHAGITEEPAAGEPAKLDYEDGVLVYELKFFSGGYEYDYEISAADGSVVKFEKEAVPESFTAQTPAGNPAPAQTPSPSGSGDIGEARAKEIALSHAGVAADSITDYQWEQDYDNGALVYELEFFAGGYEYDYKIKAADGSILKFEKDSTGIPAAQSPQGTSAAPAYIGDARAKEIAFVHAGLTADTVVRCTAELDHHDGHAGHHGSGCCEYEIDFWSGGYEYEYKIDAITGEILEFEQDLDN